MWNRWREEKFDTAQHTWLFWLFSNHCRDTTFGSVQVYHVFTLLHLLYLSFKLFFFFLIFKIFLIQKYNSCRQFTIFPYLCMRLRFIFVQWHSRFSQYSVSDIFAELVTHKTKLCYTGIFNGITTSESKMFKSSFQQNQKLQCLPLGWGKSD